jgi:predicted Holliday junction resolvase-like endonuclease
MTITLLLVASITINILLLLLVNFISKKRAEIYLSSWKVKEEKKIRSDAHARSRAVGWGKTIEKFVPWMAGFPCDPRDAMFLAKPIDYLCFTDRRNKKKSAIHFVEVKSGNANLSNDQEGIRAAIKGNRVYWHEVNVDGYLDNGKNVKTKTAKNKK